MLTAEQKAALAAEIAAPQYAALVAAGDDPALWEKLRTDKRPSPVPVAAIDVRRYLRAAGKLAAIEDDARFEADRSKRIAAQALVGALADFATFDLANPVFAAAVTRDLTACRTAGQIDDDDIAAIFAMGIADRPVLAAIGCGGATVSDVADARRALA